MVKEFRDFLLKGNVLELAVALIMGAAFGAVVTSLVDDVLMNIIAAVAGKPDFSSLTFDLGDGVIRYGSFLTALVTFVLIAGAVFFFIVRPANMLMARFRSDPKEAPPTPEDIALLREIRDLLRTR